MHCIHTLFRTCVCRSCLKNVNVIFYGFEIFFKFLLFSMLWELSICSITHFVSSSIPWFFFVFDTFGCCHPCFTGNNRINFFLSGSPTIQLPPAAWLTSTRQQPRRTATATSHIKTTTTTWYSTTAATARTLCCGGATVKSSRLVCKFILADVCTEGDG